MDIINNQEFLTGVATNMKGEKQMIYKNITFKADPFSYDLAFDRGEIEIWMLKKKTY